MAGIEMSSVGATAVMTAHMRAIESERRDRLFSDDFAAPLVAAAGLGVEAITLQQVSGTRVYESVVARTYFIDSWCERLISEGIEQVVILGSGLDTRAWRFDWLARGVRVWELDRTDVVRLKRSALDPDMSGSWHGLEVDLTDRSWPDVLSENGFDWTAPSVWIAEGLFMYLSDNAAHAIVDQISSRSSGMAALIAAHFGRGALLDAESRAMSDALRQQGYGFESVIDTEPHVWLGDRWLVCEAVSIADYAHRCGRTAGYDESAAGAEITWLFTSKLLTV